jgi:hypothetical protein
MKINGQTIRQWASRSNAVTVWRKRLATNTQKNLGRLGALITLTAAALTPPSKGRIKTLVVNYIGGATDEKTLLKHIKRIAKVLEIGDLEETITTNPTYTVQLQRLEVKLKFEGFVQAASEPEPVAEAA